MRFLERRALTASLAGMCLWSLGTFTWAGEQPPISTGPPSAALVAQADSSPSSVPSSRPPAGPPPGGTSIEDLLLQKGTITMDDWIQVRAEQEYSGAESARRLDAIEDWKTRTELLPMLRDKVNFGLNALQFLYSHQDAQDRKSVV